MACVCHSLAACQRHTPSSLLAYPIMTSFRYVSYVACVALDGNPALVVCIGGFISIAVYALVIRLARNVVPRAQ